MANYAKDVNLQTMGSEIKFSSPEAQASQRLREVLGPVLTDLLGSEMTPRALARIAHDIIIDYFTIVGKRCPSCGETLKPGQFGPNRAQSDGLQSVCRECRRK